MSCTCEFNNTVILSSAKIGKSYMVDLIILLGLINIDKFYLYRLIESCNFNDMHIGILRSTYVDLFKNRKVIYGRPNNIIRFDKY